MKISIQGNSGCELVVLKKSTGLVIKKISADRVYSSRLKKQALKQQLFFKTNALPFIQTPEILRERNSDVYTFEMQYFPSLDFITFFLQADKSEVDLCLEYIEEYCNFIVQNSQIEDISTKVIRDKYLEIKEKSAKNMFVINKASLFKKLDRFFATLPDSIRIPIGYCHGDMTFSNILFNKRKKDLVLIDFLDSFIETPLQDMVKLRQDTQYYWSFNFYEKEFDKTKMTIVFDYLDTHLHNSFKKFSFYKKYYSLFQTINFARILPYTKSELVADYLEDSLLTILQKQKQLL